MQWSLPPRAPTGDPAELFQHAGQLHQRGLHDQAEQLYRAVLAARPDHAGALRGLGFLQHERGRYAEARQLLAAALKLRPDDVAALSRLAGILTALNDPEEVLATYDRALALDPDFLDALNGRGNALMRLGRPREALVSYDAVIARKPDHVSALSNRGVALRDMERPAEALASYDRALALKPDHVWSLNNRGVALIDLQRPAEALASFDKALAYKPDYAEALNNRGKALAACESPLDLGPRYAQAAGGALPDLVRPADALASFERAISFNPDYAEAHDNRGLLLFELGRLDEAAAAVERAISLAPDRVRFYYHLTEIRRLRPGDPQLAAMQALAQDMTGRSPDEQVELHFALAKALADVGDASGSFEQLLVGNALKRSHTPYDEAATLDVLARTQAAFSAERLRAGEGRGDPSDLPVFVVGMPRSGTTLVEQILASHPQVFGAGEAGAFDQAALAFGAPSASPEDLAALDGDALARIGAGYVDWIGTAAPEAARIVNKRPDNFRFAGLIHLALPNAKLIHTRRDPIDTGVSCFSKLFGDDLAYTFDLAELGRYHRAYRTLMAHWRSALPPGVMLEVRYEDLVADLEGQARRIVAHVGLDWDPRCLDFHRTERRIRTASATQVRQPIYTTAVGRWRAHEPWLGPLLDALGPEGREG